MVGSMNAATINTETRGLLAGWIKAGIERWEKASGGMWLNDLSKAHAHIDEFENALNYMRNGSNDLYAPYVQRSIYVEFYEGLEDGFYALEQALEEAEHDLTQMIDRGWADDGYEDDVQQEIENTIHPALDEAMDEFKSNYGEVTA